MKNLITFLFVGMIFILSSCENSDSSPLGKGEVKFWTTKPYSAGIEVWVDNLYKGKIEGHFPSFDPNCGEGGTLTVSLEPGTYPYRAQSNNTEWNGTVTVPDGTCVSELFE